MSEAEIRARALEEAADEIIAPGASSAAADWLRERAAQIRAAQVIPAEAVEAAAKAIYECQPLHGFPSGEVISWDELTAGAFAKRGLMMEQARAALEAAAPHMLSHEADELAAEYRRGYRDGLVDRKQVTADPREREPGDPIE